MTIRIMLEIRGCGLRQAQTDIRQAQTDIRQTPDFKLQ